MNRDGQTTGSFWNTVIDFILPPVCNGCETAGSLICATCQEKLIWLKEPLCVICGQPNFRSGKCRQCTKVPPPIDKIRSAVLYTDPVTRIMHQFKYYDQFALTRTLTDMMLEPANELIQSNPIDVIIPIPLHSSREAERGYNQAYLLAAELSKRLNIPVVKNGLYRMRQTEMQAQLTRRERAENMDGAFQVGEVNLTNQRVMLIDDVCTTGATLYAAARCLKSAGASHVTGLCVARALKT
ncbi:MAG: ComF family protein [Anaerolineae bacterium]